MDEATVTKYGEDGAADMVYEINSGECSCPSYKFKSSCKHLEMYVEPCVGDHVPMGVATKVAQEVMKKVSQNYEFKVSLSSMPQDDEERVVSVCLTTNNPYYSKNGYAALREEGGHKVLTQITFAE